MDEERPPLKHWRTPSGVALCSLPAKQEDLVDDWVVVDCPACCGAEEALAN